MCADEMGVSIGIGVVPGTFVNGGYPDNVAVFFKPP